MPAEFHSSGCVKGSSIQVFNFRTAFKVKFTQFRMLTKFLHDLRIAFLLGSSRRFVGMQRIVLKVRLPIQLARPGPELFGVFKEPSEILCPPVSAPDWVENRFDLNPGLC